MSAPAMILPSRLDGVPCPAGAIQRRWKRVLQHPASIGQSFGREHAMSRRLVVFVVLVGLLGLFAQGGGCAAADRAAKTKRTVYFVKHGDARSLAEVLGKHFKGDAD